MLVVFHSKPAADVLMFARHALPVLRAANKPYTDTLPERGVITQEEMEQAIAGIERAIAADDESEYDDLDEDDDDKQHPISQPVSFRQRAYPLLAMMRLSLEHGTEISWEPATVW